MEDRTSAGLHLEMTSLGVDRYAAEREPELLARPGVQRSSLWKNLVPGRTDIPMRMPHFDTLAVYEVDAGFEPPADSDAVRGVHFRRYPRPGQGTISGNPTLGLSLVLVSSKSPAGAQSLRDWADFVHIRQIAETCVPGFRMITPYENASGGEPRYLHFYEMETADAETAFLQMAPLTIERITRARGRDAAKAWMGHPELVIEYVNSFARVDRTASRASVP